MIDPKLNEIPVEGREAMTGTVTEAEKAERLKRSRTGLSINDTIAGDTLLSSGARGVDTSGVSAGAGAGAGSSVVTAGQTGESPAPAVVSGERGTGTTVRAETNPAPLTQSTNVSDTLPSSSSPALNTMDVAERAYQIWCERGCPQGTAEEDWKRAERELSAARSETLAKSAAR